MFKKIAGKRNKFALLSLISEQSVNKRYFPIGRYTENQYYVRKISTEKARAFLVGAVDIAQASRLQNTYTIYSYKNEQISIIFSQEGELLYVTPDPDYLYFK